MKKNSPFKSIVPFLPLLLLYIIIVLIFSKNELVGDENRYIRYATNLVNGFFTDESNPDLGNGPLYPLVIAPFVAINVSFLILKLLNSLFIFIGVIYFKKTIEFFTKEKYAFVFAYLIGIYPPLLRRLPLILSETLAFMLICGLLFHVFELYRSEKLDWKQILITSLYLSLLVHVKVIFLQVIGLSLLIVGVLFILNRKKQNIKIALVLIGGLMLITPYLAYTYSLTGKLFYLGTGGGEILYHRSTPYENEWGNWFSREDALNGGNPDYKPRDVYRDLRQLSENHHDVYLKLEPLTHIERDSVFKTIAIENMRAHPGKYLKNTVSNIGRLLFHFPFSYRYQNLNAYGYMIPNMFIVVLWTLSLFPIFMTKKKIPFELKAIMVFNLIYACGIILSDGRGRNFVIMVPSLILFFSYVYTNLLEITLIKTKKVK